MTGKNTLAKLEHKAFLDDLQKGDVIDSSLGMLAFEGMNSAGTKYNFVSHHGSLVRASLDAVKEISGGGIYFEEGIPVSLGRGNPQRDILSTRPLLAHKPEQNQIYQSRMKLYDLAREKAGVAA